MKMCIGLAAREVYQVSPLQLPYVSFKSACSFQTSLAKRVSGKDIVVTSAEY